MALTAAQMLELIDTAIAKCLLKQRYRIGDIEYTFADLPTLDKMRIYYANKVNKAAHTGPTQTLAEF